MSTLIGKMIEKLRKSINLKPIKVSFPHRFSCKNQT